MKRFLQALVALVALGLGVFWVVTTPFQVTSPVLPDHVANLENGKLLFNVGGCISCHASVAAADIPSGGKPLKTPIGDRKSVV